MLYKNVDICDLESILTKGILSMKESGNYNWEDGKRSNNSDEVVYLFKPNKINSAHKYGIVLLEIDENIGETENKINENDVNYGLYHEFIISKVSPDHIKNIYVPGVFAEKIKGKISDETYRKITFVEITAYKAAWFDEDIATADLVLDGCRNKYHKLCNDYQMSLLSNEKCGIDTWSDLYFRGFDKNKFGAWELKCDYSIVNYNI